jgi:hypothetical protein
MTRPLFVAFVTLSLGCLVATSACAAAPPPPAPRARGSVAAHGGALGDWQVTLDRCSADETRVLTVDLHGPGTFQRKRFLRVTRVAADEDGTPTIDVELVDTKAQGGPQEIVIDPALAKKPATFGLADGVTTAHCRVAEGWIVPEPNASFSGAFRFACDTLDGAHVVGAASFAHCKGDPE